MKVMAFVAAVALCLFGPMAALAAFAVYFSGDDVNNTAVRQEVSKNPALKSAHFFKTLGVSDQAFDCLRKCKDLEIVTCIGNKFTGVGLKFLRGLPKLHKLEFEDCTLTEVGLKELPQLEVTAVNFYESTVTNAGAWYISYTPTLEYVNLSKTKVTDVGLSYLTRLPNLKYLYLLGLRVTDESGPVLANLKTLKLLDLRDTRISDKTLKQLSALPNLKTLMLADTDVTSEGIEDFKKERPGVTISN